MLNSFCSPFYLFSASTVFLSFRFYNQPCPTYATSLPPANYCVLLYNVKHILVAGRALLAGAAANHETPIPAGCPATESPRMDRPRTVRTTRTATVRTRWVSVFMPVNRLSSKVTQDSQNLKTFSVSTKSYFFKPRFQSGTSTFESASPAPTVIKVK